MADTTDATDTEGAPDVDDSDRLLAEEDNPAQGGARGGGTDASNVGAQRIGPTDDGDAAHAEPGEPGRPGDAAAEGGYGATLDRSYRRS